MKMGPCYPNNSSLPIRREGSKLHLHCGLSKHEVCLPENEVEYNKADKSKHVSTIVKIPIRHLPAEK